MEASEDLQDFKSLTTPLSPIPKSYDSISFPREQIDLLPRNVEEGSINYGNHEDPFDLQSNRPRHIDILKKTKMRKSMKTSLSNHVNSTSEKCTQTMHIGHRIQMECSKSYHYFSLQEDYDSTMIDVAKSFAPITCLGIPFFFRICWWTLTKQVLCTDYRKSIDDEEEDTILYFSHATNSTLVLTFLYQTLGCFVCLVATLRRDHRWVLYQPENKDNATPSGFICLMWFLYSLALPSELLVAIGYWALVYDPEDPDNSFINMYKHGIIGLFLLIDGNVLGRIPIRIKHFWTASAYGFMYGVWSIIFSYLQLGTERGNIYKFMDWKEDAVGTSTRIAFLIIVVGPLIFVCIWIISVLGSCFCCCCCNFSGSRRCVVSNEITIFSRSWKETNDNQREWYDIDSESLSVACSNELETDVTLYSL